MESPSDLAVLQERKFIIQNLIGEGSYAKVYRSVYLIDETRSIELACKVIDTSVAPRMYLNKFLPRELDILVRVNHPHVIQVTNIYQRHAKYFVFMRMGENGDLLNYISKNGAIPEAQSRVWMRQLICGLDYMHTLNIAHRDLKCENVLISSNFNVKLTDFGFARRTRSCGSAEEALSETFCGSLLYAAPEVLKGLPYLPKMADIWSMGVILYTMLNRALPFNETSVKVLYDKQVYDRSFISTIRYLEGRQFLVIIASAYLPGDADVPTVKLANLIRSSRRMQTCTTLCGAADLPIDEVQRKWKFRTNIVNELSTECKKQVTSMIEPDAQKRPAANAIFNGAWISMDQRLCKLTPLEETLLKQANKDIEKPWRLENTEIEPGNAKDALKTLKKIDPKVVSGGGSGPFAT